MGIAYDYSCDKCELTIEVTHSIKKTPKIKCPQCKKKMYRELGTSNYIMVKSGEEFLGDIWDKQGFDFADPEFNSKINQKRLKEKSFQLSPEEKKVADIKSIEKTGQPWKPNTPADL